MAKAPVESTPTEGLTTGLPADDYKTEQNKSGPDPVDPPVEPVKSEPVTTQANEPYPSGSPAVPPTAGVPQNQAPDTGKSGVSQ